MKILSTKPFIIHPGYYKVTELYQAALTRGLIHQNKNEKNMDVIIRHKQNKDNYRVGKDLTLNINGKSISVTPYASLSKNRDTLYFRDKGAFSSFESVMNEGAESTLSFDLTYFNVLKYKGEHSNEGWMEVRVEDVVK